jgi:MFS family permease
VLLALGLLWFTQVRADGTYLRDLVPGFLLAGAGLGFSFVPDAIAALEGVAPDDSGLASGLINTSQQIGGALGVAVLTTLATNHFETAVSSGTAPTQALVDGWHIAFAVAAGLAVVGVVATLLTIRQGRPAEQRSAEAVTVPD